MDKDILKQIINMIYTSSPLFIIQLHVSDKVYIGYLPTESIKQNLSFNMSKINSKVIFLGLLRCL